MLLKDVKKVPTKTLYRLCEEVGKIEQAKIKPKVNDETPVKMLATAFVQAINSISDVDFEILCEQGIITKEMSVVYEVVTGQKENIELWLPESEIEDNRIYSRDYPQSWAICDVVKEMTDTLNMEEIQEKASELYSAKNGMSAENRVIVNVPTLAVAIQVMERLGLVKRDGRSVIPIKIYEATKPKPEFKVVEKEPENIKKRKTDAKAFTTDVSSPEPKPKAKRGRPRKHPI